MAGVVAVASIPDHAAGTEQLALHALDDLALTAPGNGDVVAKGPDQRQQGKIRVMVGRFSPRHQLDLPSRIGGQPLGNIFDPDARSLREPRGHRAYRREMNSLCRLFLLPKTAIGQIRDVDGIAVPDQFLDKMEVREVVAEDVEALLPPAQRPDGQPNRVILAQAPQLGENFVAVGRVAGMEILEVSRRKASHNPPVELVRPPKKNPVQQSVDARAK